MFNKLYESIKKILKENWKSLFGIVLFVLLLTVELPYYINAPGGLIDVSKRIEISNSNSTTGSFNLAYVSEYKANLPMLIYAVFDKNWDVLKKEEVVASNETVEEQYFRDHLMLEEANDNAILIGFQKANKKVETTNHKLYVTYIDSSAITDLKIEDQILSVNEISIKNKQHLYEVLSELTGEIKIEVINHDIKYTRKAQFLPDQERNIIGIVVTEDKDLITDNQIELKFKKSESGPSGGFMMALSIYNYLTDKDLSNGLKIVGTGTIDEYGNVGSIGGVTYKIKAAVKNKADIFFVPSGENFEEAKKLVEKENYDLKLIEVSNIEDAIKYLKK